MHVQVGDIRLYFDVAGPKLVPDGPTMRERPTLLLLHGGPGFDHSGFKPHFLKYAELAQVVFLDHRGQGRSDAGERARWTLEQWGDDVHAFCQALGIERPVVYGVSFGGMVAQAYATRHPEHPAGLVLDSTGARMRLDRAFDAFERLGGSTARGAAERFWADPRDQQALQAYLANCLPLYNRTPQDPDVVTRTLMRTQVLEHFFERGGEGHRFDFRAALANVRCPVWVLSGLHDPITPPVLSDELEKALPKSLVKRVLVEDAGHGMYRDRPDVVETVLREALGDLE